MKMVILFLTCANEKEADKIIKSLLLKKLVVCAKKLPVSSSFLWKGKVDSSNEVMLVMDSIEEKFDAIEREVRKLHSYETPVLVSVPVNRASEGIERWMREELKEK
jgi:periplasmic divalent cation tolerance protein